MPNIIKKIFSLSTLALITALTLSGIAAWYSVVGLTAIFAAAVIPIIIMGGSLEMTFGPVALLGTAIVYSTIAVIFAAGYLRMCFGFLKQRAANAHRE
jgi:hypothetical protein